MKFVFQGVHMLFGGDFSDEIGLGKREKRENVDSFSSVEIWTMKPYSQVYGM